MPAGRFHSRKPEPSRSWLRVSPESSPNRPYPPTQHRGEVSERLGRLTWVQIPALLLSGCVTVGLSLGLSGFSLLISIVGDGSVSSQVRDSLALRALVEGVIAHLFCKAMWPGGF